MVLPVVLAPLLASFALLGADAQEPVCHGQLRPQTPVEQAMEYRRRFGLPSERAHVRRVERSGARRDEQGYAFTRREWRYWRARNRLAFGSLAIVRYLDRHPDLSGGISIEDSWPDGPYFQVRLTRGRELHEAELKRRYRYPRRLRTVSVQYSERQLREIADRVEDLEGFDVRSVYVDGDANRVQVQMVSAHPDHQAVFQDRYGPAVITFATPEDTRLDCAALDGVRVASSGRSLVLRWTYSSGDELETVELAEHSDRVEVGIVQRVPFFGGPDDALRGRTRVQLSTPLRGRRVIDAATGLEVR